MDWADWRGLRGVQDADTVGEFAESRFARRRVKLEGKIGGKNVPKRLAKYGNTRRNGPTDPNNFT
jgi:hypothetical protein